MFKLCTCICSDPGLDRGRVRRASLNFPRMTYGSRAVRRASPAAPVVLVATSMQERELFPRQAATIAAIFVLVYIHIAGSEFLLLLREVRLCQDSNFLLNKQFGDKCLDNELPIWQIQNTSFCSIFSNSLSFFVMDFLVKMKRTWKVSCKYGC